MTNTPTATTGGNVRAEMARRGVTQMALARKMGVSQAAISARLSGKTPFDINELVKIADLLDVPLSALLSGVVPSDAA